MFVTCKEFNPWTLFHSSFPTTAQLSAPLTKIHSRYMVGISIQTLEQFSSDPFIYYYDSHFPPLFHLHFIFSFYLNSFFPRFPRVNIFLPLPQLPHSPVVSILLPHLLDSSFLHISFRLTGKYEPSRDFYFFKDRRSNVVLVKFKVEYCVSQVS